MQLIDWQAVRHISRLSILNRVAFTMLFLVPLIAGFLRPVRVSVDKANAAIDKAESRTQSVQDVARGAQALAGMGSRLREELLGDGDAEATLSPAGDTQPSVASEAEPQFALADRTNPFGWNIGTPLLPRPWAMAFTAALLILLSDTIFQIWCPFVVKQDSLEEYVNEQCTQFATHPSRDVLVAARNAAKGRAPHEELLELEQSIIKELKEEDASHEYLLGELQQVRVNLVELASRENYARCANRFQIAAWVCFAIYAVSACIVLKILQEQALNVIRSSGWWFT